MNLLRKAAAAALALCTVLSCTACGEKTANAMQVGGSDVRAGIYLYYATSAYGEAIEVLRKGGENFDECETSQDYKKILSKTTIDNVKTEEWIQNKAAEHCETFIAIEKEFEALGLSLSGEEIASAESNAKSSMSYYGDFFHDTGIGEESVKDILLNSYKQEAVWDAYYGKDGKEGIEEQTLYDHYKDTHFRIKYIEMPLKDGEGNLLKADGKAEIEKMAQDYLKRLEKKKGEAEKMAEFDYLIEEHQNYVTSLSEAAVTTTDESGNTITTPTTAKSTTVDEDETTTAQAVTTAPAEEEENADGETEDTAEPAEGTTTTTTTTTAATTEEPEETTTTVTFGGPGYDTANERILVLSTSAKDAEDSDDETTTEPTYTPCQKVYEWAINPDTQYLKPELIKDDECYYVVVKLDIEDRMTEDDKWTSSTIEDVRREMYYDTFLDKLDSIAKDLPVTRNASAFRRYKVLDIDYQGYQSALMQAYSSMYGNYFGG